MAKLTKFIGPHDGQLKIYVGMWNVGSGRFKSCKDFELEFSGSYQAFGQSGEFAIAIQLTDQNPQSSSGPCSVTLNGTTDTDAEYSVAGERLTITTALNNAPIDLYVKQTGTQVDNISGHNLWIGQWG